MDSNIQKQLDETNIDQKTLIESKIKAFNDKFPPHVNEYLYVKKLISPRQGLRHRITNYNKFYNLDK